MDSSPFRKGKTMQSHTEKPPPHDTMQPASAKEMFQFLTGIFHIIVYGFGAWWAMLTKKLRTVGTRAYWLDVALCWCPMAMCANQPALMPLERHLFLGGWILMFVLFWVHLIASYASPNHVHTKCVGQSRLGDGWDVVIGLAIGGACYAAGLQFVGGFIAISATCNWIRDQMILERDRQRAVQMDDAMYEQQYTLGNYNEHGKGRL